MRLSVLLAKYSVAGLVNTLVGYAVIFTCMACGLGPVLSNAFRWSFGVGKRVRSETALGEGAVSVSFAAVALARKIFGRLQGRDRR